MANNPIPDQVQKIMEEDHGTAVLITDPKADAYLARAHKMKYGVAQDRMEKWCGGKNGFDDYVERWH